MVSSYPLPDGFTDFDVFSLGSCLLVEGLLGIILNAVTIVAFVKVKELRTPSNFLVFSLAMADIGISMNATVAAFSSFLRYWPYGSDGCQTHGFQGFTAALASIHFVATIAWDRYHQYCTRTKLQWSSAITLTVFVWLFSAFWSAMPLIGWGEYDYEPLRTCCTLDYTKGDRNYVSYLIPMTLFNMVVQVFVVMSSYQSIDQKFKKTGNPRVGTHTSRNTSTSSTPTITTISTTFSTTISTTSTTTSSISITTISITTISTPNQQEGPISASFNASTPLKTLLFCWGPYGILAFYAAIENATLVSPKLRMMAPILAKTAPTFNVFLYALGNENYRGGIWQLLTGEKIVEVPQIDNKSK
ncbi:hypothetical protein NHX12_022660 [Muraenolepis orangiensis]|uniref:G-protein coupled receptors family 1 profile domain-containing protein n=1 Tax=Muraenolepis orangiensis TaxID=630683 RepID=A0A9Q0EQM1_9TELE|nr:hypothetical protein NHX12_022660 [Muraenolepis orangiensis]